MLDPNPHGYRLRARSHLHRRRWPERTVRYRTVQTHLATWLDLIERLAAPIPPPRRHRHRYPTSVSLARYGVEVTLRNETETRRAAITRRETLSRA
ncbi:hypothetical protein [Candidatus Accumulibacter vicinus]|uniref:hypothetical protein n=1 Tax=Candidatus Accumulibacter vicinus TaxID=2954382 RepID=UPI0004B0B289|nr:hypothetical protein [Candidatus Accumulibacter vicinus]